MDQSKIVALSGSQDHYFFMLLNQIFHVQVMGKEVSKDSASDHRRSFFWKMFREMPPIKQVEATFKKAEWHKGKKSEQLKLREKD